MFGGVLEDIWISSFGVMSHEPCTRWGSSTGWTKLLKDDVPGTICWSTVITWKTPCMHLPLLSPTYRDHVGWLIVLVYIKELTHVYEESEIWVRIISIYRSIYLYIWIYLYLYIYIYMYIYIYISIHIYIYHICTSSHSLHITGINWTHSWPASNEAS